MRMQDTRVFHTKSVQIAVAAEWQGPLQFRPERNQIHNPGRHNSQIGDIAH